MKGRLQITRWSDDTVHIQIEDALSGIRFVDVEMDLTTFAQAITSMSVGVNFESSSLHLVGMTRENKQVALTRSKPYNGSWNDDAAMEECVREDLARHETDGWVGSWRDAFNNHNLVKGTVETYRVGYTRYVDAGGKPVSIAGPSPTTPGREIAGKPYIPPKQDDA